MSGAKTVNVEVRIVAGVGTAVSARNSELRTLMEDAMVAAIHATIAHYDAEKLGYPPDDVLRKAQLDARQKVRELYEARVSEAAARAANAAK